MPCFYFLESSNIIFMNTKLRGVLAFGLFIGHDHTHTFLSIDADLQLKTFT
jgi:hypothetical protein